MRKGSKRSNGSNIEVSALPLTHKDSLQVKSIVNLKPTENIFEYDKIHALPLQETSNIQFVDILLRLCDACHEMDNKTEPWSTIRKDIEKLR